MRATGRSPLALLVALVLADHEHHSIAADDLAFLAHRLDRRSYLHDPFRRLGSGDPALAAVAAAATGSWRCSRAPAEGRSPSSRTPHGSNPGSRGGARRRPPAARVALIAPSSGGRLSCCSRRPRAQAHRLLAPRPDARESGPSGPRP